MVGAFVRWNERLWRVGEVLREDGVRLVLQAENGEKRAASPQEVSCGFKVGMEVADRPWSRVRRSLGEGTVIAIRTLGGCEQVLVDFFDSGQLIWCPYENLERIRGTHERFRDGRPDPGSAERLRLKTLAWALEHWNQNTGALSRLEIDPLPHQIQLVHHILASGTLNWLIADDVGLGKTIEVGMLLAALEHRRRSERILIVTPAGLTRQWQEELADKFGMRDYQIYGRDFEVHDPSHWGLHRHVIASIDRLKSGSRLEAVSASGYWDLIVFDEAHRLTRKQRGRRFEKSERYRLASQLRQQTDELLLLTATPHQGRQDQFVALLELLRPDLKESFQRLELDPQVISEVVYRNQKASVTDADGNLVFNGQTTRALQIPSGPAERAFDQCLQRYVRKGYAVARELGRPGVAVGFVMTVFRKLAASSSAAILGALERRRDRLAEGGEQQAMDEDERFEGELEEAAPGDTGLGAFFEDEQAYLDELILMARELVCEDTKLSSFIDKIVSEVLREDPERRMLIFTEYRGTQAHIQRALKDRFGADKVVLIHGGQSVDEKRATVFRFRQDAQFLVSTEAGGEGLNLHHGCHVMVNYDLPWNPMRLVQRIGRLYRYGQTRRVLVFNLHGDQTVDARLVDLMYERLSQIVRDLTCISAEYNEDLASEIFGRMASLLDVSDILEGAAHHTGPLVTEEEMARALERARSAMELQDEVFNCAQQFDVDGLRGELPIGPEHVQAFVHGMMAITGSILQDTTYNGKVWHFRLAEDVQEELARPSGHVRLTTTRSLADGDRIEMADFDNPLFKLLAKRAKSYDFGGLFAGIRGLDGDAMFVGRLRWQNDQGRNMREEMATVAVTGAAAVLNDPATAAWLLESAVDVEPSGSERSRIALVKSAFDALDERLRSVRNRFLHPAQRRLVAGATILDSLMR